MKYAQATIRYTRVTPRKMRFVADLIRGLSVADAHAQLLVVSRRASAPLKKLLQSAVANAKNMKMDPAKLVVSEIMVDQGPMMKRFLPRARGSASPIQKKMSHTSIRLIEKATASSRFTIITKKAKKSKTEIIKSTPEKTQPSVAETTKPERGIIKRILGKGAAVKKNTSASKGRVTGDRGA